MPQIIIFLLRRGKLPREVKHIFEQLLKIKLSVKAKPTIDQKVDFAPVLEGRFSGFRAKLWYTETWFLLD